MEAFKREGRGKNIKNAKKMINQCESLVRKTERLEKFADVSLAKVEKVCEMIKLKKIEEDNLRMLRGERIGEDQKEDKTKKRRKKKVPEIVLPDPIE